MDNLDDEVNQKIDELHETLLIKIITPLFAPILKNMLQNLIKNQPIFKRLSKDIIENILFIVEHDEDFMVKTANIPNRYYVNVAVSHTPNSGSPIVFEDMPTHPNLLGHIEYITQLGTILTDASMIRAGALHKANGGYLLLEASSLLEHPMRGKG